MNETASALLEEPLDILISGGILLPMTAPGRVSENPLIGIRDGVILFIANRSACADTRFTAREIIDASGCLVLPGLINTHTHLPMTLFRGLADDLPLLTWLNKRIFPAERRFITPQTVRVCSALAIAEMILSGTTTFCDGYFFEDDIAEAAIQAGMRGVVSQGFIDLPQPDSPSGPNHATIARRFLDRWRSRSPLITPSLMCHSAYMCNAETLRTVKETALAAGVPFQLHLSETREEVELIQQRSGKRPVTYLHELGLLDESTVAAHCIWIDEDEMELLARHRVKVAHDPESNMKLGAGVAPVPAMLARGITIGLGTDGCASNNNLDLFGEMGMCAKLHKVMTGDPTAVGAEQVLAMATAGGAEVLGMADRIGSLAPGKAADLILVDCEQPHLTPLYNPFSQLVYAASGADVTTSIIAGRVVMRNRRLQTLDLDSVMAEVRTLGMQVAGHDSPVG